VGETILISTYPKRFASESMRETFDLEVFNFDAT